MFIENKAPIAWGRTWTSQMPISHKLDIIIRDMKIFIQQQSSESYQDFSAIFKVCTMGERGRK